MLDVHPPHQPTHTWKDFFIHIATIVVGLLIAVGLEQTVEYFHHRHLVSETREALKRERDVNTKVYAIKVEEFNRITPILEDDLENFQYLEKHPGTTADKLPHKFKWFAATFVPVDSAWKTAQQNGVLNYMPQGEVQDYDELYTRLHLNADASVTFRQALYEVRAYTLVDPDPSHLSPQAIDRQLQLMKAMLLAHSLQGGSQRNIAARYHDFPAPAQDLMDRIFRSPLDPDEAKDVRTMTAKAAAIRREDLSDQPKK